MECEWVWETCGRSVTLEAIGRQAIGWLASRADFAQVWLRGKTRGYERAWVQTGDYAPGERRARESEGQSKRSGSKRSMREEQEAVWAGTSERWGRQAIKSYAIMDELNFDE